MKLQINNLLSSYHFELKMNLAYIKKRIETFNNKWFIAYLKEFTKEPAFMPKLTLQDQ